MRVHVPIDYLERYENLWEFRDFLFAPLSEIRPGLLVSNGLHVARGNMLIHRCYFFGEIIMVSGKYII